MAFPAWSVQQQMDSPSNMGEDCQDTPRGVAGSMITIHVIRKPLDEGTVASNVLKWGTGAINIDGCRVQGPPPKQGATMHSDRRAEPGGGRDREGRTPASQIPKDFIKKQCSIFRLPPRRIRYGTNS